ncbi:hypothetical protein AYK25_04315 [Thermoplasmatales archaeon SM1-50]|nr:MAG: hypothetical protein AYK25_04315 [Thermoplasmatales archaeon SM1-50]
MTDKKTLFLGKKCKAELRPNHFILIGRVIDIDEHGILFKTDQKTAWINWNLLFELVPLREE